MIHDLGQASRHSMWLQPLRVCGAAFIIAYLSLFYHRFMRHEYYIPNIGPLFWAAKLAVCIGNKGALLLPHTTTDERKLKWGRTIHNCVLLWNVVPEGNKSRMQGFSKDLYSRTRIRQTYHCSKRIGKDFEQPDEVKRLQERLNLHYQVSFT